jgi:AcrR family transcriptional regulator
VGDAAVLDILNEYEQCSHHVNSHSATPMTSAARAASPRKRPVQRRSVETVERICVAAARIFDERGYHATTTNHIAEAAGVSVGSLYQYFPNKDALLVALAERHLAEATPAFEERLRRLESEQPPIEAVARSLIELTVEHNDSSRLHAEAPRTPELVAQFEVLAFMVIEALAAHLERAGTGGDQPLRRAALLTAAVDAAVHQVVLRYPPGSERRAAIDDLVDLVVGGLGAGS